MKFSKKQIENSQFLKKISHQAARTSTGLARLSGTMISRCPTQFRVKIGDVSSRLVANKTDQLVLSIEQSIDQTRLPGTYRID